MILKRPSCFQVPMLSIGFLDPNFDSAMMRCNTRCDAELLLHALATETQPVIPSSAIFGNSHLIHPIFSRQDHMHHFRPLSNMFLQTSYKKCRKSHTTKLKNIYAINFKPTWKLAEVFGINKNSRLHNSPAHLEPSVLHTTTEALSNTLLAKWNTSSCISIIFCLFTSWLVFLSQDPGAMLGISDVRVPPTWQSLLFYDTSFSNVYCNNDRFSANGKFLEQREKKKKPPKKPVQMDLGDRKTCENENNLIAIK